MLIKRLRASGETGSIEHDHEQFRLRKSADHLFFLSNFYQQYLRLPKTEHENLVRSFLTSWHTVGFKAPQDFSDAKADLLPALRARAYVEISIHRIADSYRSKFEMPHQVIAEHLAATLVYDLPQTMMSVSDELLDLWSVTFYEAMEVAKENLHQNTRQFAKAGELYALLSGDGYDATRLLLTDFIRRLEVRGETIAAVPNREQLYICGSEDADGLEMMTKLIKENFQHERNISAMAFRLVGDEWEVWLPPEDDPSYWAFHELYLQSLGLTYAEQKDLLDKRHESEGTDIFVASYSEMQDKKSGKSSSMCVWSDGVESLLPETEQVCFFSPSAPEDKKMIGPSNWDKVRRIVGDLMEPQEMYPERWRVREFPNADMLKEIAPIESR